MRKHTAIKRLSALILVLVMALPPALPAIAAQTDPPYQINIRPNKYTSTPGDLEDEIKLQGDFLSYDTCLAWANYHKTDGDTPAGKLAAEYINLVQRFKAFQIFKGDIDPNRYQEPDNPSDNTSIGSLPANALANVQWGDSIAGGKIGALLYALMTSDTLAKDAGIEKTAEALSKSPYNGIKNKDSEFDYDTLTLGDLFSAVLGGEGYTTGTNTVASATDLDLSKAAALVAKVLSDFTPSVTGNLALARAFAKIVTEKNSSTAGDYKYLNDIDDYTSTWNNDQWIIGNSGGDPDDPLQGGYYLFTDTYDESHYGHKDKAQSELILGVFGTVTMTVKASAPSVDKGIVDDNDQANKGDTAEIGDSVTFRLTGTLPENYDTAYDEYKYIFHDTLSKGLTYGSVKQVYVKVYDENGVFGTGADDDPRYNIYVIGTGANGYQEKKGADANHNGTQHTVDFDFGDLKKLQGVKAAGYDSSTGKYAADGSPGLVPITSGSEIYVEYTATLNENAIAGYDENYNEVILEYSDNPENNKETNTSTGSRAYVYTFGLDISKLDGSEEPMAALKGAGFTVSKEDVPGPWYPYYESQEAGGEPVGYITESELKAYLGADDLSSYEWSSLSGGQLKSAVEGYEGKLDLDGKYLWLNGASEPSTPLQELTLYATFKTSGTITAYAIYGKDDYTTDNPKWVTAEELVGYNNWEDADAVANAIAGYGTFPINSLVKDGGTYNGYQFVTSSDDSGAKVKSVDTPVYILTGWTYKKENAAIIETDEAGKLWVNGLDEGTYTITETKTPNGYDTMDPFTVTIKATIDPDTGKLTNLEVTVNGNEAAQLDGGRTDDGLGYIPLTLINYPAGYLPGTGGRGVYLFYIGGVALLIGAAAYLIISNGKKKNDKNGRYVTIKK